jgi:MFS family permease
VTAALTPAGSSHRRLVLSIFFVQAGSSMTSVGLTLLLVHRFGLGAATGVTLALGVVPNIVLGPLAGEIVSRYNVPRVAIGSTLVGGTLVLLYPLAGHPWVAQLVAVSVGLATLPGIPARMALRNTLIPPGEQARTSGRIVSGERLAVVIAPVICAVITSVARYEYIFVAECLFALTSSALLLGLSSAHQFAVGAGERPGVDAIAAPASWGLRRIIGQSCQAVTASTVVRLYTFTAMAYSVAIGARRVLLPALVLERFDARSVSYGAMVAAIAVGGVLGGSLARQLAAAGAGRSYLALSATEAALWATLLAVSEFWVTLGILVVIGFCEGTATAIFLTNVQALVPSQHIGRYFAVLSPATDLCVVLGLVATTSVRLGSTVTTGLVVSVACIGLPLLACSPLARDRTSVGS